jgi:hypothetical protein
LRRGIPDDGLDVSIVNVALPTIGEDLNFSQGTSSGW